MTYKIKEVNDEKLPNFIVEEESFNIIIEMP
jgi:hypothetical protein